MWTASTKRKGQSEVEKEWGMPYSENFGDVLAPRLHPHILGQDQIETVSTPRGWFVAVVTCEFKIIQDKQQEPVSFALPTWRPRATTLCLVHVKVMQSGFSPNVLNVSLWCPGVYVDSEDSHFYSSFCSLHHIRQHNQWYWSLALSLESGARVPKQNSPSRTCMVTPPALP